MSTRSDAFHCPACGETHSDLTAIPARDDRHPYRVECPVTGLLFGGRVEADGRLRVDPDLSEIEESGERA